MATSIASQLEAIKSVIQADTEPSVKRPFTRPSILFDAKEAADIDIDTIFSIALQGHSSLSICFYTERNLELSFYYFMQGIRKALVVEIEYMFFYFQVWMSL